MGSLNLDQTLVSELVNQTGLSDVKAGCVQSGLVVDGAGGEGEESERDADADAGEGAPAVGFEDQLAFAGRCRSLRWMELAEVHKAPPETARAIAGLDLARGIWLHFSLFAATSGVAVVPSFPPLGAVRRDGRSCATALSQ